MFREWRMKRLDKKLKKYTSMLESINEYFSRDKQDSIRVESLQSSRMRIRDRLNDLTWRYLILKMKVPEEVKQDPPVPHSELLTIKDLIDVIGPVRIRDGESFIRIEGLNEASIEALKRINRDCEDDETFMDRLFGEQVSSMPRQLAERIGEIFNRPENEAGVLENLLEQTRGKTIDHICTTLDEFNDRLAALETGHQELTLKDLDKAMREETAKTDPSLHGDLALLLHRLRDPINHPVNLVELAESVASGECKDPNLVASALDMLVEEFREAIGPRKSFETSDKGCLEAMDIERNTLC